MNANVVLSGALRLLATKHSSRFSVDTDLSGAVVVVDDAFNVTSFNYVNR